jgi:hypothetical protein
MQENHSHAGIQRRACDLRACDIFSRAINNQAAAWHILISTLSPCLYKETKASGLGHGKKKDDPARLPREALKPNDPCMQESSGDSGCAPRRINQVKHIRSKATIQRSTHQEKDRSHYHLS